MTSEQINKVQKELRTALEYSMEIWLVNEIESAITNHMLIKSLYADYWDSSLKYFGVEKLNW